MLLQLITAQVRVLFFFFKLFSIVIGILAQPDEQDLKLSYIAASYVKYIESAGGRVVPIDYRWSFDKLRDIFNKVNGILLPGGGAPLTNTSRCVVCVHFFLELNVFF